LEECGDTLVGDEEIGLKGISGGQKRRASVGIELIKDPALLFL
jgi:ABC-type multidrug transport system ATPase subunit